MPGSKIHWRRRNDESSRIIESPLSRCRRMDIRQIVVVQHKHTQTVGYIYINIYAVRAFIILNDCPNGRTSHECWPHQCRPQRKPNTNMMYWRSSAHSALLLWPMAERHQSAMASMAIIAGRTSAHDTYYYIPYNADLSVRRVNRTQSSYYAVCSSYIWYISNVVFCGWRKLIFWVGGWLVGCC